LRRFKMKRLFLLLLPFLVILSAYAKKGEEVRIAKGKNIKKIASDIKRGTINPGKEYGMEIGKRWHNIHSEILEIGCGKCHIEAYPDDYLYQRKYKVPVRDAPGVVRREICLECHKKGGPAETELYGKR